jgi:hypothetical protein
LTEVKARGALLAAGAVLIALAVPAGAAARGHAHPRHVEVIQPTAWASLSLGRHDGYRVGVVFEEPDLAVLTVEKLSLAKLTVSQTSYGAHFQGSLASGRVRADFGPVGSLAVRFRPGGKVREGHRLKACEGNPWRWESGRWVGKVALRGEDDYFAVSTHAAAGKLDRSFRLRCRFKHPLKLETPPSLRQRIEPQIGYSIGSLLLGSIASLTAGNREDGRRVVMRASHAIGLGPGAEVEAEAFEYQGETPVGRFVQILDAPSHSFLTSLPGERPASATVKPGAPFTGEASYLAVSPTDHSWTGSLTARFPGLVAPIAGPRFFSSLCVISPLAKPRGCDYEMPDWQSGEESAPTAARR